VAWEFVLVALCACALAYTLLDGFYVSPALQASPLPAVVVCVCVLLLFAVCAKRGRMLLGGALYAALCVVALIAAAAATPSGQFFEDTESNYFIFVMVLILTATLSFLLTRNRAGIGIYFALGAVLAGLIQLFYERNEVLLTCIFVFAALALLVYKNYQQGMSQAAVQAQAHFVPGILVAALTTLLACAVGLVVWFGVISPLSPSAAEIKLITEYRALETVQVKGLSSEYQTPNLDTTSDDTNQDSRTTDYVSESLDGTQIPATGNAQSDPNNGQVEGTFEGLNLDSLQDAFDLQSNPQNWPLLLIFIIPIILIVGYFVLRRAWRTQRLNQMRALGPDGQFEQMYLYLLGKFGRLGMRVPHGQTMLEFAKSVESTIYPFENASGVKFADLAQSYTKLAYGIKPVSEQDISNIEAFYKSFWRAARKYLGNVKYFFTSFRLH
jgi:hypothetical protein